MKKLFIITIAAILLELIAMEAELMQLPAGLGMVLGIAGIIGLVLALFDKARPDEREQVLTYQSSHVAFLTVAAVLLGILLYQTLQRSVEAWLVVTILALVIGKVGGRWYIQRKK